MAKHLNNYDFGQNLKKSGFWSEFSKISIWSTFSKILILVKIISENLDFVHSFREIFILVITFENLGFGQYFRKSRSWSKFGELRFWSKFSRISFFAKIFDKSRF